MKVTKLKIYRGLYNNESNFAYKAKIIKFKNLYFYSENNVIIKITKNDYERVLINPRLYYFSTVLRLHTSIQGKI